MCHSDTCYRIFEQPVTSTHAYALKQDWTEALKNNRYIVLFAPLQTDGIGSHGRRWVSDK